jgi:transposase-like protein
VSEDTPTPRHAPPFYCPYCGEENIRPHGQESSEYRCGSCLRVWNLRLIGTTTTAIREETS